MASNPKHDSASTQRSQLPFEPNQSHKKPGSATRKGAAPVSEARAGIPQVVSQRMARRMALFCGVPTFLGILTFPASYFVVTHGWLPLPNGAVVLVSLGLFGLGALGLTYGVFSASWEEDRPGSRLGWQEFRTNFGRMRQEWRSQREQKKS